MDTVRQRIQTQVTKARWALGLTGLLSVAFGITVVVWPDISLYSLVIVFGAFALARGVVGLAGAISAPAMPGRGWLVLSSLAGIAVGLLVFFQTDISALALLYVIGAYAIVLGIFVVAGAFRLPLDGSDSFLLGVSGAISILFGIVMFAKPGDGALVLLALIAAYALVNGVTEIVVAVGAKRILNRELNRVLAPTESQQPAKPQPAR